MNVAVTSYVRFYGAKPTKAMMCHAQGVCNGCAKVTNGVSSPKYIKPIEPPIKNRHLHIERGCLMDSHCNEVAARILRTVVIATELQLEYNKILCRGIIWHCGW